MPTPTLFPWRGGGKYRYIVKTLGLKRENRYYNCSISLKLKNHIEKELYKGRLITVVSWGEKNEKMLLFKISSTKEMKGNKDDSRIKDLNHWYGT